MPGSHLIAPAVDGTHHRWRFGEATFAVDAAIGARITEASVGGENMLVGPEAQPSHFGATCWTSPQSDWGWPPLPEHDALPYAVTASGSELELAGRPAVSSGIAIRKRFRVDPHRETFAAEYLFENRPPEGGGDGGGRPRTLAPWEISRHRVGGLTFFPRGEGIAGARSTLAAREAEGAVWFAYDKAAISDHQKLFAHGSEGWVAHVDVERGLILVKTFPEVAPSEQAPGEAQIEIYADPTHSYVEVEQQGAYRALAAGEQLGWSVVWRLRRLPRAIAATVGNRELLAFVRALVADTR